MSPKGPFWVADNGSGREWGQGENGVRSCLLRDAVIASLHGKTAEN
jgi:hypothetical protein